MKSYIKKLLQILLVRKRELWILTYIQFETRKTSQGESKINTQFWFLQLQNHQYIIFSVCSKLKRQPAHFFLFFSFFNKDKEYKNLVINSLQNTIKNQLEGSIFWRADEFGTWTLNYRHVVNFTMAAVMRRSVYSRCNS